MREEHKNIKIAAFLNLGFVFVEFIGGGLTNSLAILTDALHDLGDSITLLTSWRLQKLASRKPDWKRTFGYRRLSLLAASKNLIILLGGASIILLQTVGRLINPQPIHTGGVIGLAIFGIIINTFCSWILKKGGTTNEKILSWHLLEDVFGWIGILISGIIISYTGWYIIDPIITILFLGIVIWGAWRNSKELFNIFLEGVPTKLSLQTIVAEVEEIEGIENVYDAHVWSLDGKHHIFSMKAGIKPQDTKTRHLIKEKIHKILTEKGISHTTVELEESKYSPPKEEEQEFLGPES